MFPVALLAEASAGTEILAQVLTTVGTFVLVWLVLQKLAWKPILAMLDERRDTVAREFDDIEKKQADLAAQMKDYEARIKMIDDEARVRMNKAIDEGRQVSAQLVDKARHDAEEIVEKARASMNLELEKARVELRDRIVDMTIASTERLLAERLTEQKHRDLVLSFVNDLEKRESA